MMYNVIISDADCIGDLYDRDSNTITFNSLEKEEADELSRIALKCGAYVCFIPVME